MKLPKLIYLFGPAALAALIIKLIQYWRKK
jgi:hypothetical protein